MVKDGGWHFSGVGDLEHIITKFRSYSNFKSHRNKLGKERILTRIKEKMHPLRNDKPAGVVWSIDKMPQYIQDNLDKFEIIGGDKSEPKS